MGHRSSGIVQRKPGAGPYAFGQRVHSCGTRTERSGNTQGAILGLRIRGRNGWFNHVSILTNSRIVLWDRQHRCA